MPLDRKNIEYAHDDRLNRELMLLRQERDMLFRNSRNKRDRKSGSYKQLRLIEEDICYVWRELESRAKRREAHAKYLQKIGRSPRKNYQKNYKNRANRREKMV